MAARLLSDIHSLTPSGYDAFARCARLYYLEALLGLPPSDPGPASDDGLLVHDMLWRIHATGSCHDHAHVRDVLTAHGADTDVLRDAVARHARRCPSGATTHASHEVSLARFHRAPRPMFMAVARIDAVWVHDGLLDARDYKTGGRWHDRVADVPAAHVQVFVLAAAAARRGLRLRLRYEYLQAEVVEDPEAWEPDDDDLAAVEEELRAAVARMHDGGEWRGVRDADTCARCRFRSICRDSAVRGEPSWASLATRLG
jgi:hypothetical protein